MKTVDDRMAGTLTQEVFMQDKPVIDLKRVRRINGGFSFIPHRFLNQGFFSALGPDELVLYFFYVLAADRFGMSWYSDPSIIKHTGFDKEQLDEVRSGLKNRGLIALQSPFVQVLELPEHPLDFSYDRPGHPASRILKSLRGESE